MKRVRELAALVLAGLLTGCGGSSGHASAQATAPASSAAPVASQDAPAPALSVVPLILVHGINGGPFEYYALCDKLAKGRTVLRDIYIDEADALATGSLPADTVVNFGYYRTTVHGPDYDPHGSIGGCPLARTDGLDVSYYTTSYAERLRRCVEDVKRATGSAKVDLVLHSMGGIVGRAYTKWLSLDANGVSSVRRIFLIASPSRGINALECTGLAIAHAGNVEFMRQGECLELCAEAETWSGRSYIDLLNDDWDGFCSRHGIAYAGLSALGARGGPAGPSSGSVIPAAGIPLGPITQFLSGLTNLGSMGSIWPVALKALANLPSEVTEALGPSDGTVRLASSRLDEAPFLASGFWGLYEGTHAGTKNVEQTAHGSTYTAECIRAFCLEAKTATAARCTNLTVSTVDAPGHATWIKVDVGIAGVASDSSPLALQLVESPVGSTASVTTGASYGAVLVNGDQTIKFVVPAGGGTRSYRAVVYGEHGEIGVADGLTFTLRNGALDPAPQAVIATTLVGNRARLDLAANVPGPLYSVRFDRGPWLDWSSRASFETPPLLAGIHRVEVRVQQGTTPAAVGLLVDASGAITVLP